MHQSTEVCLAMSSKKEGTARGRRARKHALSREGTMKFGNERKLI